MTQRVLSRRELDVLHRTAKGMRPADIAEELGLSVRTVRSNLYNARRSLLIPLGAPVISLVAESRLRVLLED